MALRAELAGATPAIAIAGLPIYWDDAGKAPQLDWQKFDLFEVALMAKNIISITEL